MLTRCRQPLKPKAWALAIAKRSTIIMHATLRQGTKFKPA